MKVLSRSGYIGQTEVGTKVVRLVGILVLVLYFRLLSSIDMPSVSVWCTSFSAWGAGCVGFCVSLATRTGIQASRALEGYSCYRLVDESDLVKAFAQLVRVPEWDAAMHECLTPSRSFWISSIA